MEIIKPKNGKDLADAKSPNPLYDKRTEKGTTFKYHIQSPPNWGIIEIALPQDIIDYLWERIEEGKNNYKDYKSHLVGHISKSFIVEDTKKEFETRILGPCVKIYGETYGAIPAQDNCYGIFAPQVTDMWCNYQYQTEFNPPHSHMGIWSFVIWMKIPYEFKEQQEKPDFMNKVPDMHRKAGSFEFEYTDTLGAIRNATYPLSSDYEGRMVFFPSTMRHVAYPFYNCDGERVSISGNIAYVSAEGKKNESTWLNKPICYKDPELNTAKDKNELTPNQKDVVKYLNNSKEKDLIEKFSMSDKNPENNRINPLYYPIGIDEIAKREGLNIKPKKT